MSSCLLQPLVNIRDFQSIRQFLFTNTADPQPMETMMDTSWDDDDWGDDGWEVEDTAMEVDNVDTNVPSDNSWIRKCKIAISPNVDYMCISYADKTVFLHNKPQVSASGGTSNSFEVCWKGMLPEHQNGEEICYILCLPLVSLKRTSHGSSDWTCFMFGFSSGYIRAYTETGSLLLSQIFHDTPVIEIVCSTFDRWAHMSYAGAVEQKDELTILHQDSTLVVVDGFSLFQTMRACRNQLALAAASGMATQDPPPLACRKWRLDAQQQTTSHICVPMGEMTPFQRIMNISLDHVDKKQTGNITQYVVVGASPFIGYYYAAEGSTRPILSYVASAVANKLTKQASALISAASGWIKWGTQAATGAVPQPEEEPKKPAPKIAPSTPLDRHSTLPDALRRGSKIVLAPGKRGLAALSDGLGRVCLIDVNTRSILRMWKGYRDAEVGFIRTYDDTPSHRHKIKQSGAPRKLALFIVIYAPRRGILEIWSCIHGPRVGAFNISKHDRLLFPGHGMLGMNLEKSLGSAQMMQCCLFDSQSGSIRDIFIPFHLALSDSKSNKAHDVHLLKKIAQMLHTKARDGEEILKLITEMRLCSIQKQALLKFLHTKRIGAASFVKCLTLLIEKYSNATKKEEKDFVRLMSAKRDLIEIYEQIDQLNSDFQSPENFTNWDELPNNLVTNMLLSEVEAQSAAKLIKNYKESSHESTVRFQNQMDLGVDVAEFLDCFVMERDEECGYRASIDQKKSSVLGCFLFHSTLFGNVSSNKVITTIRKITGINTQQKQLLNIAILHWMDYEKQVYGSYTRLIDLMTSLNWNDDVVEDTTWLSWLDDLRRDVITVAKQPLAAYVTVLVIRAHMLNIKKKQQTGQKCEDLQAGGDDQQKPVDTSDKSEWETLSMEHERWNNLMKQMEDSLHLNTCIKLGNKILQVSTSSKQDEEQETTSMCPLVSVHDLLTNGTGHPSELIASVLSNSNIKPSLVSLTSPLDHDDVIKDEEGQLSGNDKKFINELINCRNFRFPFSLSANSIHSHCFWEEMVKWNKSLQNMKGLKRGLAHLSLITCQPFIQRGLALLAWSMFVHKKIVQLAKLVDKVGKSPKQRLCLKEVGITDTNMSEFCECAISLLQIIADADCDQYPQPSSPQMLLHTNDDGHESIESNWSDISGKESIIEMARKQPDINYKLIQHFMNLSFVLRATMEFSLRGVKPLTLLFDGVGRKAFDSDLTSTNLHMPNNDVVTSSISNARKKFINSVIEASVEKMSLQQEGNKHDNHVIDDLQEWVDTCVHISTEFNINNEQTHTYYIDLLYSYGLDQRGAQQLEIIADREVIASKLLLTVGQRFGYYLKQVSPEVGVLILAQMPTILSTWINSQDLTSLKKPDVPLEDTLELARKVSMILPEVDGESSLPLLLVEALNAALDS